MTIAATVRVELKGTYTDSQTGAGETGQVASIPIETLINSGAFATLTDGVGANQADKWWASEGRALVTETDEDIDLFDFGSLNTGAGAGLDALGQALSLADIVAILVRNRSTSAGNLLVGGEGSTAAWNSLFNADDEAKIVLPPGAIFLACSPSNTAWAVADSSNHLLTMGAPAGAVTYDIYLLGRDS